MGRLGRREEKSSASDYYRERKAGDCGHARMSRTMLPLFPGRASRSSTATFVYLRREKFSLSFSTIFPPIGSSLLISRCLENAPPTSNDPAKREGGKGGSEDPAMIEKDGTGLISRWNSAFLHTWRTSLHPNSSNHRSNFPPRLEKSPFLPRFLLSPLQGSMMISRR